MEKLGRMTDVGRDVLPVMLEKGFVIDKDILTVLQLDIKALDNF